MLDDELSSLYRGVERSSSTVVVIVVVVVVVCAAGHPAEANC